MVDADAGPVIAARRVRREKRNHLGHVIDLDHAARSHSASATRYRRLPGGLVFFARVVIMPPGATALKRIGWCIYSIASALVMREADIPRGLSALYRLGQVGGLRRIHHRAMGFEQMRDRGLDEKEWRAQIDRDRLFPIRGRHVAAWENMMTPATLHSASRRPNAATAARRRSNSRRPRDRRHRQSPWRRSPAADRSVSRSPASFTSTQAYGSAGAVTQLKGRGVAQTGERLLSPARLLPRISPIFGMVRFSHQMAKLYPPFTG